MNRVFYISGALQLNKTRYQSQLARIIFPGSVISGSLYKAYSAKNVVINDNNS